MEITRAYSGFAVDDVPAARAFYAETIGLAVTELHGMLLLDLGTGAHVLVYPKDRHDPASFTVLNLEVPDVAAAVDELAGRGVVFERYDGVEQDERGIMRDQGPLIAWFRDPAGNVVSVIED